MNVKRASRGVLLVPLLAALLAAACAAPEQAKPPIRVGAILHLTGGFAELGSQLREGMDLRFEEAKYEVSGRKIDVIIEDDATDPAKSLEKAKKLVETDRVSLIIGPLHSGTGMAVAPYVSSAKIPNIAFSAHPWDWTAKFDYTFGFMGSLRQSTKAMGWHAYDVLGLRKVTTIASDFVAGRMYMGGFIDGFVEKGGTVVQQQWTPLDTKDFAPYLTVLQPADATIAWISPPGGITFLKQYGEHGIYKKMPLHAPMLTGFVEPAYAKEVGDSAKGIQGAGHYTSLLDNPQNKRFVELFRSKYGKPPSWSMNANGYIAASVAIEALKATQGDTSADKLSKAIMGLKLDTPIGPVRFDSSRFGIRDGHIVEVTKVNGDWAWKVLKTYTETKPIPD